jgi:hypothetical protein
MRKFIEVNCRSLAIRDTRSTTTLTEFIPISYRQHELQQFRRPAKWPLFGAVLGFAVSAWKCAFALRYNQGLTLDTVLKPLFG